MTTKQLIRKSLIIGTVSTVALIISSNAFAAKLPDYVERDLVRVCEAIKDNNRLKLRQAVKDSRLSYRQLQDKLVCNGQDMYTFAMTHGAEETQNMIARRTNMDATTMTAKR